MCKTRWKKSQVHVPHRQLWIIVFTQDSADVGDAFLLSSVADIIEHFLINVHRVQDSVRSDRASHRNGIGPAAGADVGNNVSRLELKLRNDLFDLQDPVRIFHTLDVLIRRPLGQLESGHV
jgi:hypothetical protein